jgi:hypothetical protein
MRWLTLDEAIAQGFQVRGSPLPQVIELAADSEKVAAQIPVPPRHLEMGDIPGPSCQWYGLIGERAVILEGERSKHALVPDRIFVHTSYLEPQDTLGDWVVMHEFTELPGAICLTRPLHIMSRNRKREHVVYRPDPAGWNANIYDAASRHEAEELLDFLKQDAWNEGCFVGAPEPEGYWSAMRSDGGGQHVLCTYPHRNAALSFACNESSRTPSAVIVVKDRSSATNEQYVVSGGRVIERIL